MGDILGNNQGSDGGMGTAICRPSGSVYFTGLFPA